MRFTIEKPNLASNIQHLINLVPSKNINPTILNFLVEADVDSQQLKFTATDMDITAAVRIKANVIESGKAAVSAKNLLEIVTSLEDKPIDFRVEEGYLKIHCSQANFSLLCAEHSQFPILPEFDFESAHSVSATLFAKMIDITSIAVSHEATRPIFTGILWRLTPELQTMGATDGKKIAEVNKAHKLNIEGKEEKVIPTKALYFLQKIIDNQTPELKYLLEPNRVIFSYKNYTLMSQTIAGRFPRYGKALQAENPYSLIINKIVLRQAVRRVALLATEEFFRIKFEVTENSIIISSFNFEMGNATEEITNFEYDGPSFSIAFNYKYILSVINVIETDKMKMRIAEPVEGIVNDQVLFYNHPELENYDATILIMPLRLK